ncbi:MAG: hypothetical protein U0694_06690 [Anaerolineae bacterium]
MTDQPRRYILLTSYSEDFHKVNALIHHTLKEIGAEPIFDLPGMEGTVVHQIRQAIQRADFVIADVTGKNLT